jgi:hypothetical protein
MATSIDYGARESKEVDLDAPIFVYYVNVGGMSHQHANQILAEINEYWSFPNITTWIVPRQQGETKIECVYDGRIRERSEQLKELIDELNEKVDIMAKSGSYEDFKIAVRDWRLENLFR